MSQTAAWIIYNKSIGLNNSVFKAWLIQVKPTHSHTHLSLSSAAFSASSSFCKAVASLSWARSSSSSTSWMRLFREATSASAYVQDGEKANEQEGGERQREHEWEFNIHPQHSSVVTEAWLIGHSHTHKELFYKLTAPNWSSLNTRFAPGHVFTMQNK